MRSFSRYLTAALAGAMILVWCLGVGLAWADYTPLQWLFGINVNGANVASWQGHLATTQFIPPTVSGCGTSPTINGTDTAGTVTLGTGTPTGCVITFFYAYVAAPHCLLVWHGTPLAAQSYTVTATAITVTQTATSSDVIEYMCVGQPTG